MQIHKGYSVKCNSCDNSISYDKNKNYKKFKNRKKAIMFFINCGWNPKIDGSWQCPDCICEYDRPIEESPEWFLATAS